MNDNSEFYNPADAFLPDADAAQDWQYEAERPYTPAFEGPIIPFSAAEVERLKEDGLPVKEPVKRPREHFIPGRTPTEPEPAGAPSALDIQIGGSHYKEFPIQPIEFFLANKIGYTEGAIIKYILRHTQKNGKEDLLKARHFIDILIEHYYPETIPA